MELLSDNLTEDMVSKLVEEQVEKVVKKEVEKEQAAREKKKVKKQVTLQESWMRAEKKVTQKVGSETHREVSEVNLNLNLDSPVEAAGGLKEERSDAEELLDELKVWLLDRLEDRLMVRELIWEMSSDSVGVSVKAEVVEAREINHNLDTPVEDEIVMK